MRVRITFAAMVASLALVAFGAPTASAASTNSASPQVTTAGPLYTMPIQGMAKNGKTFTGTYGIYKFVVKDNKVWSVGTLTGKLKNRHVTRANVMMPATLTDNSVGGAQTAVDCNVLHLVLAPINLNLLGLKVTLGGGAQMNQPIVLDITAQQGGGLLGDLLCGLTNALGGGVLGQLTGQLQQLASTLNSIVSLLGGLQATQP